MSREQRTVGLHPRERRNRGHRDHQLLATRIDISRGVTQIRLSQAKHRRNVGARNAAVAAGVWVGGERPTADLARHGNVARFHS